MIPKQINKFLAEWCHNVICHPGKTRFKLTIGQHVYWKGLQKSVHNICAKYHTCQFLKCGKIHYGNPPAKQADTNHRIRYVLT